MVVDGIHKSIASLEKSTLFDLGLAYHKRWQARDFRDELKKDIKDKQSRLSSRLKRVENSIQVCVVNNNIVITLDWWKHLSYYCT